MIKVKLPPLVINGMNDLLAMKWDPTALCMWLLNSESDWLVVVPSVD